MGPSWNQYCWTVNCAGTQPTLHFFDLQASDRGNHGSLVVIRILALPGSDRGNMVRPERIELPVFPFHRCYPPSSDGGTGGARLPSSPCKLIIAGSNYLG